MKKNALLVAVAGLGLAGGLAARWSGWPSLAADCWLATVVLVLGFVCADMLRRLAKGALGVDLIAALAMAGAVLLQENLAGAVIALMYVGGGALEDFARARASRELAALLGRTPRQAHRLTSADTITDVPVADVRAGDRVLIKTGEIVPTDGQPCDGPAILDESALTGEALPVTRREGDAVRSGTVNAGSPFKMRATACAADSTYAAIVRLVETAQASKAPFTRLADRFAVALVPFTLIIAAIAYGISGDPVRALAVLVVATPCPLILAVPVAIISGISRAARRGVLIKNGGALEELAGARVLLMDKTGTLTTGRARLMSIEACDGWEPNEVLRLAASVDQASHHVMAAAVVAAAYDRRLSLANATEIGEEPGAGIAGTIAGRRVMVGSLDWVRGCKDGAWSRDVLRHLALHGGLGVFVAVDGHPAGCLLFADEIRPEAPRMLRALRSAGIQRMVMVSGDRRDVAETTGAILEIDTVLAQCTPEQKVDAVRREADKGHTVMVGDGINDAPALAAADIGVALGARGAGASSEAADVVLMEDRLDRLAEGLEIARRTRRIALESVLAGMGLSVAGMVVAAAGWLPPVEGAIFQEAVDATVILNALRALAPPRFRGRPTLPEGKAKELGEVHRSLLLIVDRIQAAADRLDAMPSREARNEIIEIDRLLRDQLLPHEREDDTVLYPTLAKLLGGQDPMATMSSAHREVRRLARQIEHMARGIGTEGPDSDERRELRRCLYGLSAILKLHFSQEEEIFQSLS